MPLPWVRRHPRRGRGSPPHSAERNFPRFQLTTARKSGIIDTQYRKCDEETSFPSAVLQREDIRCKSLSGAELQDGPLDLFRQSITANELENVTALQGDLRQMRTLLPHGSMDYVICNPPYFDRNAGANAPTAEKRTARQDATCSVEELAVAASFVLHTGGKAAFVFRPERLWVLLEALSRVRLVPKRMRFVHQSVQASPSVVMVECRKGGSAEGLVVEPPLIVESDEYFRIYGIEH